MAGFEPTTSRLLSECSTAKLHRHVKILQRCRQHRLPVVVKRRSPKNSDTGTRTQVARVKAEYPNQLDYIGYGITLRSQHQTKPISKASNKNIKGPLADSNRRPLRPKRRIIPLDQTACTKLTQSKTSIQEKTPQKQIPPPGIEPGS